MSLPYSFIVVPEFLIISSYLKGVYSSIWNFWDKLRAVTLGCFKLAALLKRVQKQVRSDTFLRDKQSVRKYILYLEFNVSCDCILRLHCEGNIGKRYFFGSQSFWTLFTSQWLWRIRIVSWTIVGFPMKFIDCFLR